MKLATCHTITDYKKYYCSFNLKSLSNNTLWQILKSLKPGTQKPIAGLDNFNADRLQSFKTIESTLANTADDPEKIQ